MRRPALAVTVVTVAALAVGTGVAVLVSGAGTAGPRTAATAWLDALAAGDADAARALLAEPDAVPAEAWDALASASERIVADDLEVDEADDAATAVAQVSLGDEHVSYSFDLVPSDDGWRVAEAPLAELSASSTRGTRVSVDGRSLLLDPALDGGAPSTTTVVFPGVYEVSSWPAEYLDDAEQVVVGFDGAAAAELDPAYTDAAQADAEAALAAHLETCVETADAVADACGLLVPWPADLVELVEVAYRVDAEPEAVVDLDAGSFQATGGSVVATARGFTTDGAEAEFSYRTDDWALRGVIGVDDEGLLLSVF